MMKLKKILTNRKVWNWQSFQIVLEWEDCISQELGIPLLYENKMQHSKFVRRNPLVSKLMQTKQNTFVYEMFPLDDRSHNMSNIFPCIIDFYLKGNDLKKFYKRYKRNKVTFISSKEVYDMIVNDGNPINISHLPLSLSDKYRLSPSDHFTKNYDVIMVGRQNPVLQGYFNEYLKLHPTVSYITSTLDKETNTSIYKTSDGKVLGSLENREDYMNTLKLAKIAFYSTPGIDGGEVRTKGYNQVTPRFLEFVACGCHIIARYPSNPDTAYYELEKFSPNIKSYKEFENRMNKLLETEVDYQAHAEYLTDHYTSARIKELKRVLSTL